MDAINLGFDVIVVRDAIYAVDIPAGSKNNAIDTMKNKGAVFLSSNDILHELARANSSVRGITG
jgi:nicotinamidase-related amidase